MKAVVLRVPSAPAFVHFLGAHAAGLGARAGLTIDAIDDIRLAIDEAAACLLDHVGNHSEFVLEIMPRGDGLEAHLLLDGRFEEWPPPELESELARKVLVALSDEVSFEVRGDSAAIRIFKKSGTDL